MAEIVLDGITRRYGDAVALDDVSLRIADGELFVLLGPSGCGKTTLLRTIAGLVEPTGGRVLVDGEDVTGLSPGDRDLAVVFQSYALYPHLTVERNLAFGLRGRGHSRREVAERVRTVAAQLGLQELLRRRPRELSGGQRQRVAVGRAIIRHPRAFLMDEPLSNLDAQLRGATRVELSELHRRLGSTFVYVTHDQVEAMTMATRVAVLNAGRVEQVGTPAEIYDAPATSFVAGFLGAPPMNLLPATARGEHGRVTVAGPGVRATLWAGACPERAVTVGVRPERLRVGGDGEVRIEAEVVTVENLGSEEVAVCRVGETRVAARGPRPIGLAAGARVALTASAADATLFDAGSGRRLEWVPDATGGTPAATASASPAPVGGS